MIFEGLRPEVRGYRQKITSAHGQCWGHIVIQERGREGRGNAWSMGQRVKGKGS